MPFGFLGRDVDSSTVERNEYVKQLRKEGGYSDSVTDEYIARSGERQVKGQVAAKTRLTMIKKKARSEAIAKQNTWNKPAKTQSFKQVLRNIARSQQSFARQQGPPRERYVREDHNNFFEHKDELDVYGDEGLTFFDSNKRRGGRTGSLFGI